MAVGKNITWKRERGSIIVLPIRLLGRIIKWGKGEGEGNFKIIFFLNGGGEEYQVVYNFIHPWIYVNGIFYFVPY